MAIQLVPTHTVPGISAHSQARPAQRERPAEGEPLSRPARCQRPAGSAQRARPRLNCIDVRKRPVRGTVAWYLDDVLTDRARYAALTARDSRFDGVFYVGVR